MIYSKYENRGPQRVVLPSGLAGPNEHFEKTGQRVVGSIGRHRLLLESIKPLNSTIDEVSAQQLALR